MGLRGPKPKGKVKIKWSSNFAYAIGLIATDGCLSGDGRHIELTSKDKEQLLNFMKCLGIENKIGSKRGIGNSRSKRVQFGDVLFYQFLVGIGLTPAKSKTLGIVRVPKKYFFDFLRGAFDGDGSFYSYYDPRWRSSFMYYLVFISASRTHIDWLRVELTERLNIRGHVTQDGKEGVFQLKYGKREALKIIKKIYNDKKSICLTRKINKIKKALQINGEML